MKCQRCNREYNIYSMLETEDNIASNYDRYDYPIFFNGKEYLGVRCKCGAISIVEKEKRA